MVAPQLYPFSTQNGSAIPLEIVQPTGFLRLNLTGGTVKESEIPEGFEYCWVYSSEDDVVLKMGGSVLPDPIVEDTLYSDAVLIPAGIPIAIKTTPGDISLLSDINTVVSFSFFLQWAALVQSKQTSVG